MHFAMQHISRKMLFATVVHGVRYRHISNCICVACCRILYAVLGDEVTYNNKTLYKWNSQNIGSSPEAVFKLPSPVVLLPKKEQGVVVVLEMHIVS
jgi:hypothetical protein